MAEVSTGKFGYVTLLGTMSGGETRCEMECFVMAQEDRFSIIATLGGEEGVTSDASWSRAAGSAAAAATESDGTTLRVPELNVVLELHKVESTAVRAVPQSRTVTRRFTPRPSVSSLLSCFYQSEFGKSAEAQAQIKACSTDDGGRSVRQLEAENKRLAKELAALKGRQRAARGRSSPTRSPERKGRNHFIGSVASDEEEEGVQSASDYSENGTEKNKVDPLVRMMREFSYSEGDKRGGPAGGRYPGAEAARQAASGEKGQPQSSDPVRDLPRGHAAGAAAASSGDVAMTREDIHMQMEFEMLKLLKDLRDNGMRRPVDGDDAPNAQELDGLRVMRNLGRMRALREHLEAEPDKVYWEYRRHWVAELGAEGRAFRWTDSHKAVKWKKYASIKRMDWMLCHLVETLDTGNAALARAQGVQCMKALREFTNFGSWRAAWPMTHMTDPLRRYTHGGMEAETEVVLGWLRTTDDLEARVMRSSKRVQDHLSEEDGEETAEKPEGKGPGKGNKKK